MNTEKLTNSQIKQFEMIIRCSRIRYFRSERLEDSINDIVENGNNLIKQLDELLKPKQTNHIHQLVNIYNININNNIKKGIIYLLMCNGDDSLIYIGSTTQSLAQRLSEHKYNYKMNREGSCSKCLFDKGEVIAIKIDTVFFTNKNQLLNFEGLYIEHYRNIGYNVINRKSSSGIYSGLNQTEKNKILNKIQLETKIQCVCGKYTSLHHKVRHEKTQYHQNFINNQ